MVAVLGAPPEARVLLRNVWFGFVPLTGLLDFDPRAA